MSLRTAATRAKYIGYIIWMFERILKLLRFVGKKGYEVLVDKAKYEVDIRVGDTHVEVKEDMSLNDVNCVLKAMKTLDHVTLIIRRCK